MKVVFMGTPDFSVPALESILAAGHDVVCVYAQPPRKAGRGQKLRPTPVHAFADAANIEVRTPVSFKDPVDQNAFANLDADVAVVVAYGLLLPPAILNAPRLGCVNIHASLLPRWRGAAPLQRAILAGDTQSGVTIMQMDEGLDTGPMISVQSLSIDHMNGEDLHGALSDMGKTMIVDVLAKFELGDTAAQPQPDNGAVYAKKIDKSELAIDWTQTAKTVEAQIRAFYPHAWCNINAVRVRVLAAEISSGAHPTTEPGTTLDAALLVACGNDAVRLTTLQPAGKKPMPVEAFLNGHAVAPGTIIGAMKP